MQKLDLESKDIINANINVLGNLFPNTIIESEDGIKISFDLLKQELSKDIVEGSKEMYQLMWPGKKEAILSANTITTNTLQPNINKSLDFKNTENIYIEGDNLEVLKVLQESYLNKIKCIYIDPPYNTGKDFLYNDKFNKNIYEELEESGQIDELGGKLISNTETNGRYHSAWLSMMYPRLKLARNLLAEDGVIFISIDDNEKSNLEKLCDSIFGESSKVGTIIQAKGNAQNDAISIQKNHEYILVYQKMKKYNLSKEIPVLGFVEDLTIEVQKDNDEFYYVGSGLTTGGAGGTLNNRLNLGYTIYYNEETDDKIAKMDYDKTKASYSNSEEEVYNDDQELLARGYVKIRAPKKGNLLGRWSWSMDKFNAEKDSIIINKSTNGYSVRKKEIVPSADVVKIDNKYFYKMQKSKNIRSIWEYSSGAGTTKLQNLFNDKYFDNPKNLDMIEYIVKISQLKQNDIVLDFFSGSATTAHAAMQLNAEDGGNRKYIMVQLNEKTDEKSEAYKAGYKDICEIGQERIRRAAKKIKEETGADIDYGFRVYELTSSIMNDVYYSPDKVGQFQLSEFESNIKEDRTPEDILTHVMLDLGLTLDLKIEEREISGKKVFYVAGNSLVACFDKSISMEVVEEMCKEKPLKIVFNEACFASDQEKINVRERIKRLSPETEVNVI